MTKLVLIYLIICAPIYAAEIIPAGIEPNEKKTAKIIPVFLPDGSPAKNLTVKISTYPMMKFGKADKQKTENTYKTNEKGELIIPAKNDFISYVIDVKDYALHIQAYYPLTELRLMRDQGFDAILLDEQNQPIKNREICVSQSIGIIWGQIHIPKGINQTTTNGNGEFTMRQMILNSKEGTCMADINFVNVQSKLELLHFGFKHTFYSPEFKKPDERIKVIKFENEFTGKWTGEAADHTMLITPTEMLLKANKSKIKAYYKIIQKSGKTYELEIVIDSDKKEQFLGQQINDSRNYLNCTLVIKDDQSIEITVRNSHTKAKAETPVFKFKRE